MKSVECNLCKKFFRISGFSKHHKSCTGIVNCIHCNGSLSGFQKRFCSQTCSATFNNLKRGSKYAKSCEVCGRFTINRRFCSQKCCGFYKRQQEEIKANKGNGSKRTIKEILLRNQDFKCIMCGNFEWMGKKITLETHHLDGNADNDKLDNLQLLCPNCHSITDNYRNKNSGNGRAKRRQRYAETGFC